jgi:hypothetical protein
MQTANANIKKINQRVEGETSGKPKGDLVNRKTNKEDEE